MTQPEPIADENPPAFNIPQPVLLLVVAMVGVHLIRTQLIGPQADFWVLNTFALWPIFYHAQPEQLVAPLSIYWSPVPHGFLHGDWAHLLVNLVWRDKKSAKMQKC